MSLKIAFVAAALALATAGIVHAADDPIAARQALMKKNGAAAKVAVGFLKGDPYDAAKAAEAMKAIAADMTEFVTLFPEGSDHGGDTTASPEIWKDMDGFKALAAQTVTHANAAADAAAGGLDSFKTAFMAVGGDCQSCHQKFRVKK